MDFGALVKATRKNKVSAKELSKFPEVKRDLALLIDKEVTFSALRDIAFAAERKLLKRVSLFDVYEGDKLPEGKIVCPEFRTGGQDPDADRQDDRAGDGQPDSSVRTQGGCAGAGLIFETPVCGRQVCPPAERVPSERQDYEAL